MPSVNCPGCKRAIPFEMNELDTILECAACSERFTPRTALASQPAPVSTTGIDPWTEAQVPLPPPPQTYAAPEPWFYSFLERYAHLLMWVGVATVMLGAAVLLMTAIIYGATRGGNYVATCLVLLWGGAVLFLVLLGLLVMVAFILLAVDAARNLRALRQHQERFD
jgi:hypothetical protein